jgi:hypothetical protein
MSLWKALTGTYDGTNFDEVRIDAGSNSLQVIDYEHHHVHSGNHYFLESYAVLGEEVFDFCIQTADTASWAHVVFKFWSAKELTFDMYELVDFDADGLVTPQFANNRAKAFSGVHDGGNDNATVMTDSTASFEVDALIGWTIHNITDASYGVITDNDATSVTVAALIGGTGDDWDNDDQYEINKSLTVIRIGATVNSVGIRIGGGHGGVGTSPVQSLTGVGGRETEWVLRPNTKYMWRFTSSAADNHFAYNAEWYEHANIH